LTQGQNKQTESHDLIRQEVEYAIRKWLWTDGRRWTARALWTGFALIVTGLNLALFLLMFTDIGSTWVQKGWFVANSAAGSTVKVDTSAIEAATRNVIAVMGPLFTGLVLWLVTIVAERRLKAYDEAIEKLTEKLEKKFDDFKSATEDDIKDFKKLVSESSDRLKKDNTDSFTTFREGVEKDSEKLKAETNATFTAFRNDVEKFMEKAKAEIEKNLERETGARVSAEIDSQKSRLDDAIQSYKSELQESVSKSNTLAETLNDRFGAIADNAGYAKTKRGPLSSVGRVHKEVSELFAEGKRDEAVLMVRDMLEQFRSQTGTLRPAGDLKDDWFNLSAVLGRNDEEGLALEVCLAGLEQQNGAPVFT